VKRGGVLAEKGMEVDLEGPLCSLWSGARSCDETLGCLRPFFPLAMGEEQEAGVGVGVGAGGGRRRCEGE